MVRFLHNILPKILCDILVTPHIQLQIQLLTYVSIPVAAGWKINQVMGAMYAPELYTGIFNLDFYAIFEFKYNSYQLSNIIATG